ncbi:glycosyltransferase family 9 protein [Accumulibacter sp.]|nr:glycosyltransferase family 9 protein [Accumulibacter sp.]MCM8626091.1 methyltransferase domain-containing protein [Accumulibacter sp.]
MPTCKRQRWLPAAVANFLAQDFADAELLIVSEDGFPDSLVAALAGGRVRHAACPPGLSLGAKRNLAGELAHGEILAHWDDDDWYAPDRLSRQYAALHGDPGKALCGSGRVYFRELDGDRAWEYRYQGSRRPWLCGATLMYRRAFWLAHRFPDQAIGEDNAFVWSARPGQALDLDDPALCVASVHAGNSSRKQTNGAWWTPVPRSRIEALIAASATRGANSVEGRPRAVLALAGGLGDVLRWASLIPVLDAAGYAVDLLVAADQPDCTALFDGAAGVRRVLAAGRPGDAPPAGEPPPELAVFAYWAIPFADRLPARRQFAADRERWIVEGDCGCIAAIAGELGWRAPLPVPPLSPLLARTADATTAGTLAIHAGCKPGWPWKKWHGYGEVAGHFACVLRVGTATDDDANGTYFGEPIRWPEHVRDATTPRSLADTARLIAGCTAMVANDSGLMHLAAALGVPTLGIFGLTSPAREAMPWPALHTLTGGLDCEPACRRQPWGRRDCERHLQCLKQIQPSAVAARLREIAPGLAEKGIAESRPSGAAPIAVGPARAPLPLAVRLGGGFGDLLLAGRVIERLRELAGHGEVVCYGERPELAEQALVGRGLIVAARPLREWPAAGGLRVEITQFVRFFDSPVRWRPTHPELAGVIATSNRRIESVRGLVDHHPHLDGFWARFNQAAGRRRGESLAWTAGLDIDPTDPSPAGASGRTPHESPLCVSLDEADAGPRLRLAAEGRRWVTVHDGFDTSARVSPGGAVKCWPLEHWRELVGRLGAARPELRIVQIGGPSSRPIPGVDDCLIGRIRLGEALWLLHGAELHIDGESGLVHAAHALGTPSVVLFGPTDAGFFGYPANANLSAGVCAPCWWSTPDWMGRCPRGLERPECMTAINPATVFAAALARLDAAAAQPRPRLRVAVGAVWTAPGEAAGERLAELERNAGIVYGTDGHGHGPASGCHLHASKRWEYGFALDALAGLDGKRLRVADLGCGRGALGPWLAALGHAVSGFDRDFAWDGRPDAAARFLAWAPTQGFRPRPATLHALPEPDADPGRGFDVVLMISVLQHLAHPALALAEAARIVRPGGRIVLTFDLASDPRRFEDPRHRRSIASPDRLGEWLGIAAGETVLDDERIGRSAIALQAAGVAGIPPGLTVGGLCLVRED